MKNRPFAVVNIHVVEQNKRRPPDTDPITLSTLSIVFSQGKPGCILALPGIPKPDSQTPGTVAKCVRVLTHPEPNPAVSMKMQSNQIKSGTK